MRQILYGMALFLLMGPAWADPPVLAPGAAVPEPIVHLADMVAFRLTNCNVIGSFEQPQVSRTCDLPVPAGSTPVALREVQVHTSPYAEQVGQLFWAAQCWVRVHFSEDGVTFREVAKFTWPPGDFHGMTHVQNQVMRELLFATHRDTVAKFAVEIAMQLENQWMRLRYLASPTSVPLQGERPTISLQHFFFSAARKILTQFGGRKNKK